MQTPGAPQTVDILQKLAAGYRASKIIGCTVVDESNQTIGKVDDLLVARDSHEQYAVLSVGGIFGVGSHLVVMDFHRLRVCGKNIVLLGGTQDELKELPVFSYAKE
jgi:hypothetical protein